jgi:hypothetical protein
MIDTINLWLPSEDLTETDILAELSLKLTNTTTKTYDKTGRVTITGYLGSLSVMLAETGICISGSLSKYYKGNNMYTLTFEEIKEAFTKMGNELGVSIENAKVNRLDITENYVVDYPVANYFPYMGDKTHYPKSAAEGGLYYNGSKQTILFYDKVKERKEKKEPVLDCFVGKNVFRYELRFMSRLGRQFGREPLFVSDLLDRAFFKTLLILYIKQYHSIYKHKSMLHYSSLQINNCNEFWKQIKLYGIQALGGEAALLQTINQARKDKAFKNRMDATRIVKGIKDLYQAPALAVSSSFIDELDCKIETGINEYIKLHLD